MTRREMLWVETFWTADESVWEKLFFDFRAIPSDKSGKMPQWGRYMWHEPCDWMLPTPDWVPGSIYRERFGLRPPPLRKLETGDLELEVRVKSANAQVGAYKTGLRTRLDLSKRFAKDAETVSAGPAGIVFEDPALLEWLAQKPAGPWTASQLEQITGGKWIVAPKDNWTCQSAVVGTSHIDFVPGPVIFAAHSLKDRIVHESYTDPPSKHWDSHRRLARNGHRLAAAIVKHVPDGMPPDLPLLQSVDPLLAALRIGVAARKRLHGKVVCVTGSSGKTSTTTMMGHVLSKVVSTRCTYDNYNSRVGLLANLAGVPAETDVVILETALSAINSASYRHIKEVEPDVAIITNISTAHLRKGETTRDIARRKSNIFLGMRPGSLAVIWRGSDHFRYMAGRVAELGLKLVTYGAEDDADFHLLEFDSETGTTKVKTPASTFSFNLGARAHHMAINSLACLVVAAELEPDLKAFLPGFSSVESLPGRGKVYQIEVDGRSVLLQDDSYNANPASMAAALLSFADSAAQSARKVLILGDMLELGESTGDLHKALVPKIAHASPDKMVLVGQEMCKLASALKDLGIDVETAQSAKDVIELMPTFLRNGDAVLVKSSNGVGLGSLVSHLLNR